MCTFVFVLFASFFGYRHRHVNEMPYVDVGIYTIHLSYHNKTEQAAQALRFGPREDNNHPVESFGSVTTLVRHSQIVCCILISACCILIFVDYIIYVCRILLSEVHRIVEPVEEVHCPMYSAY